MAYDLKSGQPVQEGDQREAVLVPREMAWADGKPTMVPSATWARPPTSPQRWTPARLRSALSGPGTLRSGTSRPRGGCRSASRGRDDRRGGWSAPPRRGASVGTYLRWPRWPAGRSLLQLGFEKWRRTTAADRFTKISAGVLDHRKFWDAMRTVSPMSWPRSSTAWPWAWSAPSAWTSPAGAGHANFGTYSASTNDKAPIAARGKAKQNGPICACRLAW